MPIKMKFEPSDNNFEVLVKKLTGFKGKILFGVPRETSSNREDSHKADNAYILSIMEHGSPVKNIPPRELLKPVLEKHLDKIKTYFNELYKCLLEGDSKGADSIMEQLALRVETWGKSYFTEDNGWAPNKPATIKRKGSDKPLIDTGSLRQSIRGIYVKK